jgi:hypothetical protein
MPAQFPIVANASAGIVAILSANAAANAASELTGKTVAAEKQNSIKPR